MAEAIDFLRGSEADLPRSDKSTLSSSRAVRLTLQDVFGADADEATSAFKRLSSDRGSHHLAAAAKIVDSVASALSDPAASVSARRMADRLDALSESLAGGGRPERNERI